MLMVDWPGANVGRSIVVLCGILVLVVVLPDGLPLGAVDGDDGSEVVVVAVPFMTTPGGPPVGVSVPTT